MSDDNTPEKAALDVPDKPEGMEPQPMLAGRFAIYDDGKGGFYLFTDTGDGTQRKHIPAALVKMATGGGFMGKKLAGIFG